MPHRIEALPGDGQYALTFRLADGSERTAIVRVSTGGTDTSDGAGRTDVAEASLPEGWVAGAPRLAAEAAVQAFHQARASGPRTALLRDVDGGWDVMLGNVTLSADGIPECGAHGPMEPAAESGEWRCAECGARARLGD
jgi:hypothetical protein